MKVLLTEIGRIEPYCFYGRVVSVQGLLIEVSGIHSLSVGARCIIYSRDNHETNCEIVGFRQEKALCMAFGPLEGIGLGCKVVIADHEPVIRPDHHWLGRVINAMGEPIDGKGPLSIGPETYALRASPPPAHSRRMD